MLSNFGDVVYYLALMNYILQLADTKIALSMVTISETIPIFTLIFAGVWADWTKNKVDTIIATQFFRVLLYLVIGLAMGFAPALWIVLVASSINVIADIAGQYESLLYLPLSLRIVPQEDREAMVAVRRGFGSILQIFFRSSGALLIGIMTYQSLAFLNAGTFLVSALIMCTLRPAFLKILPALPLEEKEDPSENRQEKHLVKDTLASLQQTYKTMQEIPALGFFTKMIALGNMTAIGPVLTVLMLKEDKNFTIISAAMTLSLFMIASLVGSVMGSF
ncbi:MULTISPECIES: MFS transporter [unclassified Streptococcus]|uniref:MFS transporter n=1 Tax=unclassified Streptococcus TaxID=2608887 RepID=UPI0009E67AD9|nr:MULTISPECIES: MFS transporter [unclassified Streptococcus]